MLDQQVRGAHGAPLLPLLRYRPAVVLAAPPLLACPEQMANLAIQCQRGKMTRHIQVVAVPAGLGCMAALLSLQLPSLSQPGNTARKSVCNAPRRSRFQVLERRKYLWSQQKGSMSRHPIQLQPPRNLKGITHGT